MKKLYLNTILFLMLSVGVLLAQGGYSFAADAVKAPAKARSGPISAPDASWTVRCNKNDKAKATDPKRGRCETFQRLIVKETKKRFVEAAVGFPKDKPNARGIFIVPLGILLQPGIEMKIDNGKPFKFQARFCDNGGCYGYVDLDSNLLATMSKGTKITLTFVAANQQPVSVELSLKDFDKTLGEISK